MRPLFGYILSHRLPVNYQLVNRLISVNYSFRHVGTIRLTLAPHPLEILSHLHGISAHLHLKTQSDYAEQNSVEGSDNNVRNTLCGIVRHSTLCRLCRIRHSSHAHSFIFSAVSPSPHRPAVLSGRLANGQRSVFRCLICS